MTNGQIKLAQSHDDLTREMQLESFNADEDNDQVAIVTLDPLNLIHQQQQNQPKPSSRPFTAPALFYANNISTIINIPGQVPQ